MPIFPLEKVGPYSVLRLVLLSCVIALLAASLPATAATVDLVAVGRQADLDLLETLLSPEIRLKRIEFSGNDMRTKLAVIVAAGMKFDLIAGPYPILRNLAVPGGLAELTKVPEIARRIKPKASDDVLPITYREALIYQGKIYGILLKDSQALDQRLFVAMSPTSTKPTDTARVLAWVADRVTTLPASPSTVKAVAENYLRDYYVEKDYKTAFFYLARESLKEYWDWGWLTEQEYLRSAKDSFFHGVPVVSVRVGQPVQLSIWSPMPGKAFRNVWEVPYALGYRTTGGVVERSDKLYIIGGLTNHWSVILPMSSNPK